MSKKKYFVEGMHCPSCEIYVESQFKNRNGIKSVKSNNKTQELEIDVNSDMKIETVINEINKNMEGSGYTIKTELKDRKGNLQEYLLPFFIALFVIILFFILEKFIIKNTFSLDEMSYTTVFLIGIIASISSCMAVVGSLVLSMSSVYAKNSMNSKSMTIFHISRLISFFIFGGILGSIGSLFVISNKIEFIIGIILTIIMIALGVNLLDISPLFRKFELTIPKKLSTKLLSDTKNSSFAPILFGAITFILPCGFTQAMQLNAVLSGTFINGALTMLIFSIGTLPVLLLITLGSRKIINSKYSELFLKSSGFLVIFFTIYNLIGLLIANGIII